MKLSAKTGHLQTTTDTTSVQDKTQTSKTADTVSSWSQLKTTSNTKTQAKKSKGFIDFINEKLHQWPIWNKIFPSDKQTQEEKTPTPPTPSISETQIDKYHRQNNLKVIHMKTKELPWDIFFGRSSYGNIYQYYHCKEDNKTYFYTVYGRYSSLSQQKGYQIFAPQAISNQKQRYYNLNRIMAYPTQIVKPLIQQDKKKGRVK